MSLSTVIVARASTTAWYQRNGKIYKYPCVKANVPETWRDRKVAILLYDEFKALIDELERLREENAVLRQILTLIAQAIVEGLRHMQATDQLQQLLQKLEEILSKTSIRQQQTMQSQTS